MNKSIQFFILAIITTLLLQSCAQLSGFQTARVLPENDAEIGFAAGGLSTFNASDLGGDLGIISVPVVEAFGRVGLGNHFDVGLKVSSTLSGVFDGKWQFVGDQDSKFAMATGLGLGFQGGAANAFLMQAHIPLDMSIHPSERFAVYFSPRYINQFALGKNLEGAKLSYLGMSSGIEAGKRVKFVLDFSFFNIVSKSLENTPNLFQFGAGVKFRLNGGEE